MARSTKQSLADLEAFAPRFGAGCGARKLALIREIAPASLASARQVERFHEALCFLRAYPDDAELLGEVERQLARFAKRRDLRRHRAELADTGIAGTDTYYPFFAPTARWLASRWPERLHVDWPSLARAERLEARLPLIALWTETPALDEIAWSPKRWVERLKGPGETDATFLVRSLARVGRDPHQRDALYDELGLELRLEGGADTPSRTRARFPGRPVRFRAAPLDRERPDLASVTRLRPRAVRELSVAAGERAVDLAREAMITRARDLDAFAHADARDARIVIWEDGLEFLVLGVRPERRLLLESVYAFLTLQSGVPIGYVLVSALMRSSEIAYNVFETFRGGEAARVYGRVLATARHLFGSDTFTIYPYQLGGDGNSEGLKSGAWWFYQKLGFRSRDAGVLDLMRRELAAMRSDPSHRSSIATLRSLARENVYWSLGRARDDVIGMFPLSEVGLAAVDSIAGRFGSERERAARELAREAAELLGARGWRRWPSAGRLAFERWAPLVLALPGVERWSAARRRALVDVIAKKGGRRESAFVLAFDRHRELRSALRRLVRERRGSRSAGGGRGP
jgi:hypothetical protein